MSVNLDVLVIALCMVGAAFFSGVETGVISLHRLRLRHFVKRGDRRAHILQGFLDNPDRLLGTTLAGTNICVVVTAVLAANLAADNKWGAWGQVGSTTLVTVALLIFSEYLPKAWFHSKPLDRCLRVAPVLLAAEVILKPLSAGIIWLTRWLVPGPAASISKSDPFLTKDELKILAGQGEKDGVLTASERAMIARVFELSGRRARDIMVPRAKMALVYADTSIVEFLQVARTHRFTRIPVLDRATDRFIGTVSVFAVAAADSDGRGKSLAGFVRPPLLTPENTPVDDILPRMRRLRQPVSLVVDQKGEVTGLLTVEDILKEIVGQL